MMKLTRHWKRGLCLGLALAGMAQAVSAGEGAAQSPAYEVTETEIILPGVRIDRATMEVSIEASVCLEEGILEFVVCKPNTFEHEAIFVTEAKPELVHAALLLSGLKPTAQVRGLDEIWFEKAMKQKASRVKIEVEWKEGGELQRKNLTRLLRNREVLEGSPDGDEEARKEAKVQDAWVFAGSFMQKKRENDERFYAANLSGILVGIWPDLSALIQYGIPSGNPYEGKHQGFEIDEEEVPKLGTKVRLILSRMPSTVDQVAPADGRESEAPVDK